MVGSSETTKQSPARKKPKIGRLSRAKQALRRLGVSESDVARQPAISDMLKRMLGSAHKAIEILRFSSSESAEAIIDVYDSIPVGDRKYIAMEAICLKADVEPARLFGEVAITMRDLRSKESAMIAMDAHPDIVRKTIEFAKLPGGDKDRRMLHDSLGFTPTPKAGGINVNLGFQLPGGPPTPPGKSLPAPVDEDDDPIEEPLGIFTSVTNRLDEWTADRRELLGSGE